MDTKTIKELSAEAADKPAGIAVLVDAPIVRQLLEENEDLLNAAKIGFEALSDPHLPEWKQREAASALRAAIKAALP